MSDTRPKLPDKLYFRIGEVSDIVGVKPYVLRYWESEFPDIKPSKSKSGQRLYKKKDVQLLLKIRELLYGERYTINGAKQQLKETPKAELSEENTARESESIEKEEEKREEEPELFSQINEKKEKVSTDRKFLSKVKADLEWCLTELRSEG